ncbi:MAG: hypothetical protein V5A55_03705 [Halovenus sp.]
MGAFSLYPLLDADAATDGTAREILDPYVEAYPDVEYLTPDIEIDDEKRVLPDVALDVGTLESFAELFLDLEKYPEFVTLRLWGPDSERFPLLVEHFALQQLSDPDLYEFHALDDERTLVVAESRLEYGQARDDVPAAALP